MAIRKAPLKVELRPLAEEDIPTLEQHLFSGPPNRHRQRYEFQKYGEGVCLVAWSGGLPIGHGIISWAGPPDEPMASQLGDCPDIEDLFVLPQFRSQGVGSQLLDALEERARQLGYSRVGLGVAQDNARARALYERRGYTDAGFGHYWHYAYQLDERGTLSSRVESCIYMIKQLK